MMNASKSKSVKSTETLFDSLVLLINGVLNHASVSFPIKLGVDSRGVGLEVPLSFQFLLLPEIAQRRVRKFDTVVVFIHDIPADALRETEFSGNVCDLFQTFSISIVHVTFASLERQVVLCSSSKTEITPVDDCIK